MTEPEADPIGVWSEIKLQILKKYFPAYSKIMGSQAWCRGYFYIDGFAGKGQHVRRDTGEMVDGSPMLAIQTKPPFEHCYFIDIDQFHLRLLRNRIGEREDVTYIHGDANTEVLRILESITFESRKRALCLLDPYGLHLEWSVIETAGRQKTVDLFLNFPVADMNRNALRKELDSVSADARRRMTTVCGGEWWIDLCFARPQQTLFGDSFREKVAGYRALKDAFRKRLEAQAGFKVVPEPVLMKNEHGGPLYYLFFATQKESSAAKIVTDIFNAQRKKYSHLIE